MSMSEPISERSWHPLGAHYSTERSAWLVLFYRYRPDGFEFAQHVYDSAEVATLLESEMGGMS